MSDKNVMMPTNASYDEKAAAIVEAAQRVIANATKANQLEAMVISLVTACLTYASVEVTIRDEASDQVKATVFKDAMMDVAAIMGVQLDVLPASKVLN